MKHVKSLWWSLGLLLLLFTGCSSDVDKPEEGENLEIEERNATPKNLGSDTIDSDNLENSENVIDNAIARYDISLSDDEKAAILKPIEESLSDQTKTNHLKDLRAKIESMLDLRQAQLKGDPKFESLLKNQIGNNLSQSDWENTVFNVPDMDALNDARKKLDEQFPASIEEAILQAQDALFKQALTQKLREEVTKEIVVNLSEVKEFLSQYKADNNLHVFYMSKHRNAEEAALELKKDQYWNEWLTTQN